jgi:hypothetical protein
MRGNRCDGRECRTQIGTELECEGRVFIVAPPVCLCSLSRSPRKVLLTLRAARRLEEPSQRQIQIEAYTLANFGAGNQNGEVMKQSFPIPWSTGAKSDLLLKTSSGPETILKIHTAFETRNCDRTNRRGRAVRARRRLAGAHPIVQSNGLMLRRDSRLCAVRHTRCRHSSVTIAVATRHIGAAMKVQPHACACRTTA